MQSCSKPFTYAICLNELGSEVGPSVGAAILATISVKETKFLKIIFSKDKKGKNSAADS
jgi:hypothetical protein